MFANWFYRSLKQVRFSLREPDEESDGLITTEKPPLEPKSKAYRPYLTATIAFTLIPVFTGLTALWLHSSMSSTYHPPFDTSGYLCAPNGVSISVAHERGCDFDWMSFHWLPKERFDEENLALIHEFEAIRPWQRFADAEGKQLLSREDMMSRSSAYLTRREHLHHCQYSIRQAYMFMARGDDPPFSYHHIVHCTDTLIEAIYESPPEDMDDLVIRAVSFPEHPEVIKPYYPCNEETEFSCISS